MATDIDPFAVLRELQHEDPRGPSPAVPPVRVDLVTAEEILNDLLPASLKGIVSVRWIRQNVTGKIRVGKQDMWTRANVFRFFEGK